MNALVKFKSALMAPVSLERWLYAVAAAYASPEEALDAIVGGLNSQELKEALPRSEWSFLENVGGALKLGPEKTLYNALLDANWVANQRLDFARYPVARSMYASLQAWLEAERQGWHSFPQRTSSWSHTCKKIDPRYFWTQSLERLIPKKDFKLVAALSSKRGRGHSVVLQELFDHPELVEPTLAAYEEGEPFALDTDPVEAKGEELASVQTEAVELQLNVKLVAALRAIAAFQNKPFEKLLNEVFADGLVSLSVSQ